MTTSTNTTRLPTASLWAMKRRMTIWVWLRRIDRELALGGGGRHLVDLHAVLGGLQLLAVAAVGRSGLPEGGVACQP